MNLIVNISIVLRNIHRVAIFIPIFFGFQKLGDKKLPIEKKEHHSTGKGYFLGCAHGANTFCAQWKIKCE